jgi:hypothetical protein
MRLGNWGLAAWGAVEEVKGVEMWNQVNFRKWDGRYVVHTYLNEFLENLVSDVERERERRKPGTN